MCVILLQIHEIIIFDFCELYHEIKKQGISRKGGGATKLNQDLYISSHKPTRGGLLVC